MKKKTEVLTASAEDVQLMAVARDFVNKLNPRFVDYIIDNDKELLEKSTAYTARKVALIRRLRPKKSKTNMKYAQTLLRLNTEWNKLEAVYGKTYNKELFTNINEVVNETVTVSSLIDDFKNGLGM